MELTTKATYATPDDFLNYWGIDLEANLRDEESAVGSSKADRFLMRVERRLMEWIEANSYRNYDWNRLTPLQSSYMREAVLEQAFYVYRNSDISSDSGYDPDRGVVADESYLRRIEVCRPAMDALKRGALLNHVMQNRRRWTKLF